jgi:hypothetical protein
MSIVAGRSQEEAAQILRVKVETLASWRSKGVGPKYRKIGRAVVYPDDFLAEFIEACTREPEPAKVRRQRSALAAEAAQSTNT